MADRRVIRAGGGPLADVQGGGQGLSRKPVGGPAISHYDQTVDISGSHMALPVTALDALAALQASAKLGNIPCWNKGGISLVVCFNIADTTDEQASGQSLGILPQQIFAVVDDVPARGSSCFHDLSPPAGILCPRSWLDETPFPSTSNGVAPSTCPSATVPIMYMRYGTMSLVTTYLGTEQASVAATARAIQSSPEIISVILYGDAALVVWPRTYFVPSHISDKPWVSHASGFQLRRRSRVLLRKLMCVNPPGSESGVRSCSACRPS
ncbi:hypothetical protein OIDMADRAFT_48151 [Oidiodendron maius Zn]|uniref:Uncharacterized protein n=1 Tax=Oidiodendron maius (strain Zn) TaxID=913774 RepID=A0A0C3I1H1_OIDMZ|nr:hypothetical protein OIDMADRAFT_48151 [Oidiodendron maius Zn]